MQFKEESKKQSTRIWSQFRDFVPEHEFELGPPGEESFSLFFNFLRQEKKFASTTLWTYYSCLNSIMKRKYNVKLQELSRLTMLIKGFNTDIENKVPIFEEMQLKAFMLGNIESSYWLVRQAVSIVAFFGGLRLQECQALVLEKMIRTSDGYKITHSRVKQRSDQRESVFLVPAHGGFADRLGMYLGKVNSNLNKFTGRGWWTGTKGDMLRATPMGKNMIAKVPHDVSMRLKLPKPEDYTFHSYRRTSATSASNRGMTSEQMQEFFDRKHASMCQEYISTCKPAIMHMAQTLGSFDLRLLEVKEEERAQQLLVMVEDEQNDKKGVLLEEFEDLSNFFMEEDPDMYAAAGISFPAMSTRSNNKVNIQQTIESAISSVPAFQGANVTVKVLVMENNNGTIHF